MGRTAGPNRATVVMLLVVAAWACAPADDPVGSEAQAPAAGAPASLHLAEHFARATIEGAPPEIDDFLLIDWRFDRPFEPLPEEEEEEEEEEKEDDEEEQEDPEDAAAAAPGEIVHGVEAVIGIENLAVDSGRLRGDVTERCALRFERRPDGDDDLYAVELRMQASAGEKLSITVRVDREFDRKDFREGVGDRWTWRQSAELIPGDALQTYVIELPRPRANTKEIRHLLVQPTDADTASFEIESVRLVSRREHLAGQAANVDWRGLGEIYRQTLLMHVTESVHFELRLPERPWLELALGTLEAYPTTFAVHVQKTGARDAPRRVLRRTITTEDRWDETPIDLSEWAGQDVRLSFSLRSDHEEQVGYFGGPVIRNRGAPPRVDGRDLTDAPQGVILVLADTLRRDHLEVYGYERTTAPFLAQLASDGALFKDDISQATWTKVSVPSILSSMYPTTNGVQGPGDKVPESVTMLAENYQQAGYATFATSSVPFTGRITNLQQGVDIFHERGSLGELDHSGSKTARTYVDRLANWIDAHDEQPFFALLHIFDPHSPFHTYDPYVGLWSEEGGLEAHEKDIERVKEVDDDIQRGGDLLPDLAQFEAAGVPHEPFVARELDWYDESIRAMDAEIARLIERLEEAGLADRTLIAFTSDHGEEFLEHGRHFHDNNAYGEMTNVPLILWGPGWVPPGTVVEQTVQTLDLYPTLLELTGLPLPDGPQGRSLVPLLRGSAGFRPRPAFVSRFVSDEDEPEDNDIGSFAMVFNGYRLVHNVVRPEEHPEFELYDHTNDPLNLNDIAAAHPEKVDDMARELELWLKWTKSLRVESDGEAEELSDEELGQLRELGYTGG